MDTGIYLSEDLLNKLKLRSDIHHVRPLKNKEICFLKELGIEYNSSHQSVDLLKHNVTCSARRGQVWVDRAKEFKGEIKEFQIKNHIENLFDMFSQIVSPAQLPIIIDVLQNALSFKMTESEESSSDFSIFACRVGEQGDYSICVFHITAKQCSTIFDLLLSFFGQKVLSIHFLGYHLRQIYALKN